MSDNWDAPAPVPIRARNRRAVSDDNGSESDDSDEGEFSGLVNLFDYVPIVPQDRDQALLDLFTCPLCEGIIYPCYLQCKNFHVVCEACLSRIEGDKCPFCRGRKPYKKNHR